MNDKKKSHDVLGVQPLAKAVEIATKGAIDGAASFLSRICLPAAEEFGLLLKERVSHWRTQNLVAIINKTESLLQEHGGVKNLKAHPKIINEILEKGSWTDDSNIQEMWAGLLASSCTKDGSDESNLVFVNLLGQITSAQARFFNHVCLNTQKKLSIDNLVYAESMNISPIQLVEIWRDSDLHRIDRELDHLRALELIRGASLYTMKSM
ncbi:MAG: Abi-alpha family protein [Candidatus Scalindua sediminis]